MNPHKCTCNCILSNNGPPSTYRWCACTKGYQDAKLSSGCCNQLNENLQLCIEGKTQGHQLNKNLQLCIQGKIQGHKAS
jgi:hypothetical protein